MYSCPGSRDGESSRPLPRRQKRFCANLTRPRRSHPAKIVRWNVSSWNSRGGEMALEAPRDAHQQLIVQGLSELRPKNQLTIPKIVAVTLAAIWRQVALCGERGGSGSHRCVPRAEELRGHSSSGRIRGCRFRTALRSDRTRGLGRLTLESLQQVIPSGDSILLDYERTCVIGDGWIDNFGRCAQSG